MVKVQILPFHQYILSDNIIWAVTLRISIAWKIWWRCQYCQVWFVNQSIQCARITLNLFYLIIESCQIFYTIWWRWKYCNFFKTYYIRLSDNITGTVTRAFCIENMRSALLLTGLQHRIRLIQLNYNLIENMFPVKIPPVHHIFHSSLFTRLSKRSKHYGENFVKILDCGDHRKYGFSDDTACLLSGRDITAVTIGKILKTTQYDMY